jgi:hypothetical protein
VSFALLKIYFLKSIINSVPLKYLSDEAHALQETKPVHEHWLAIGLRCPFD